MLGHLFGYLVEIHERGLFVLHAGFKPGGMAAIFGKPEFIGVIFIKRVITQSSFIFSDIPVPGVEGYKQIKEYYGDKRADRIRPEYKYQNRVSYQLGSRYQNVSKYFGI